jgi:hypothetical protein
VYYKYGVLLDNSTGFNEAPPVILKGLERLRWAAMRTVAEAHRIANENGFHVSDRPKIPDNFQDFNELLTLGYPAGGKINVSRTSMT